MKTRAYISRNVIVDEDPAYNQDLYFINANECEIGELSFDQLVNIHKLIGEQIEKTMNESKSN
jgi:hypothetical protein